jgi:selenocysteine-specific translation elongation factor
VAPALTVAALGSPRIAAELGKKGTTSDVTLFDRVRDGHALTVVEPTQFPEKFPPLLTAIAMADRLLFVVGELSRPVAEAAAAVALYPTPVTVLRGEAIGDGELDRAFKGLPLASAPREALELPRLREELQTQTAASQPGPVAVRLDHAFPVKGVGAVALGLVRRGTVRAHDQLRLLPTEKTVEVRSIQVHDVDVKEAASGERVGLALKGVDADELARGQVLADGEGWQVAAEISGRGLVRSPYYRGDVGPGAQIHAQIGLQWSVARVAEWGPERCRLELDRSVAWEKDDPAYLVDLDATSGARAIGRITLS